PINRSLADQLARLFPNIQQLFFSRCLLTDGESCSYLANLLSRLPNLISFNLGDSNGVKDDSKTNAIMMQTIRPMTSLRHLYLCTVRIDKALPAKMLPHLDNLFVSTFSCNAAFISSLAKLKSSCRVRLTVTYMAVYRDTFEVIMETINNKSNPQLALQI